MSANDEEKYPWIRAEMELLKQSVELDLPVIGICLGGQLLAKALGGRVTRNYSREIGWHAIEVSDSGFQDPIITAGGRMPTVYHWHGDTFILPPNAHLLAHSQHCERQAFKVNDQVYGFQFHPEADDALIKEWLSLPEAQVEISEALLHSHSQSIQCSTHQHEQTIKWELFSLSLSAAIASIFRSRPISNLNPTIFEKLVDLAGSNNLLKILINGAENKTLLLRGFISRLFSISNGNFIFFKEKSGEVWPVRIEDIQQCEVL